MMSASSRSEMPGEVLNPPQSHIWLKEWLGGLGVSILIACLTFILTRYYWMAHNRWREIGRFFYDTSSDALIIAAGAALGVSAVAAFYKRKPHVALALLTALGSTALLPMILPSWRFRWLFWGASIVLPPASTVWAVNTRYRYVAALLSLLALVWWGYPRASCTIDGGRWVRDGMAGQAQFCLVTYPDADKPCTSSSQCEGGCIIVDWTDPENPPTEGVCKGDNRPFGCWGYLEMGGIICSD